MPWKESSVMEERLRFVARLLDGERMTDLCREFGISRKTGYKVFNRYKQHGCLGLTDQMEAEIEAVIAEIDAAGGMYRAVETGRVQAMLGRSALAAQERIESGAENVVGVNCYTDDNESVASPPPYRPDAEAMRAHVERCKAYKTERNQGEVAKALDALARAANDDTDNIFARVVEAAEAGITHGEIVGCLRRDLGFGDPMIVE